MKGQAVLVLYQMVTGKKPLEAEASTLCYVHSCKFRAVQNCQSQNVFKNYIVLFLKQPPKIKRIFKFRVNSKSNSNILLHFTLYIYYKSQLQCELHKDTATLK